MIDDNDKNIQDNSDYSKSDYNNDALKPKVSTSPLWKFIAALALVATLAVVTIPYWLDSVRKLLGLATADEGIVLNYTEHGEPEDAFTASLIKRLDAMEKRWAKTPIGGDNKNVNSTQPHVINDEVLKQMTIALQKFQNIEQRLTALEERHLRTVKVFDLYDEVQRLVDEAKPFHEPLNQLSELLVHTPELQSSLFEVAEYASIGIPTRQQIQEEMQRVFTNLEAQRREESQELSWWQRIVEGFKNLFHIRKANDVTKVSSTQLGYALKIAKVKLDAGSLLDALEILKPFEREFSAPIQTVYSHLVARYTAEKSLQAINQFLSTPRFMKMMLGPVE